MCRILLQAQPVAGTACCCSSCCGAVRTLTAQLTTIDTYCSTLNCCSLFSNRFCGKQRPTTLPCLLPQACAQAPLAEWNYIEIQGAVMSLSFGRHLFPSFAYFPSCTMKCPHLPVAHSRTYRIHRRTAHTGMVLKDNGHYTNETHTCCATATASASAPGRWQRIATHCTCQGV